jgi:hypothetical protein
MGSKMVVDRQKSAEAVLAAGRTHKDPLTSWFGESFGADAGPAVALIVSKAIARLERDLAAMVRADDANLSELADDAGALAARDGSAADTYAALTELREVGTAVYGADHMRRLGFEGSTPQDATAIARLADFVLANVATVAPPAPRKTGLTLDASQWTAPLTASAGALKAALSNVATEKREAESTLVAKNAAVAAYDKSFSVAANLLSAFLASAGQKELARRVRPSTRKPGQTASDAETEMTTASTGSDA